MADPLLIEGVTMLEFLVVALAFAFVITLALIVGWDSIRDLWRNESGDE